MSDDELCDIDMELSETRNELRIEEEKVQDLKTLLSEARAERDAARECGNEFLVTRGFSRTVGTEERLLCSECQHHEQHVAPELAKLQAERDAALVELKELGRTLGYLTPRAKDLVERGLHELHLRWYSATSEQEGRRPSESTLMR